MSQQPETLTLDALARETTPCNHCDAKGYVGVQWRGMRCENCEGSGRRVRYPRLSRACLDAECLRKDGYVAWGYSQTKHPECAGTHIIPLPLDTEAVGPLLASVEDAGYWYKLYTSGDEYGHPGHCVQIMRMDGALESPPLFGETPEAALLAALVWAAKEAKHD